MTKNHAFDNTKYSETEKTGQYLKNDKQYVIGGYVQK